MKTPIPKSMEQKLRKLGEYQSKANQLESEVRHWLFKNNYDKVLVDMLIDSLQSGDMTYFIDFLNGKTNIYGVNVTMFETDNSNMDESDYL